MLGTHFTLSRGCLGCSNVEFFSDCVWWEYVICHQRNLIEIQWPRMHSTFTASHALWEACLWLRFEKSMCRRRSSADDSKSHPPLALLDSSRNLCSTHDRMVSNDQSLPFQAQKQNDAWFRKWEPMSRGRMLRQWGLKPCSEAMSSHLVPWDERKSHFSNGQVKHWQNSLLECVAIVSIAHQSVVIQVCFGFVLASGEYRGCIAGSLVCKTVGRSITRCCWSSTP